MNDVKMMLYLRVMLMSVLRALVNNLFKKSFDVTFMENKKSC